MNVFILRLNYISIVMNAIRNGLAVSKMLTRPCSSSSSADELAHFAQLAKSWWDVQGPQRILHKMNLLRLDYIRDTLVANSGSSKPGYSLNLLPEAAKRKYAAENEVPNDLNALDVGCGGGILAESLARTNIVRHVKGIDLSPEVLEVAKLHSQQDPALTDKLQYELKGIEDISNEKYDLITMFELLEHVREPADVLSKAIDLLNPGGWLFLSTINRTPMSWFTTIFLGEQVLKIVPRGTHTWAKYINESELREWLKDQKQCEFVRSDGCLYVPGRGWKLTSDRSMGNYFMAFRRS